MITRHKYLMMLNTTIMQRAKLIVSPKTVNRIHLCKALLPQIHMVRAINITLVRTVKTKKTILTISHHLSTFDPTHQIMYMCKEVISTIASRTAKVKAAH